MQYIEIHISEYLVQFIKERFTCLDNGAVLLPQFTTMWYAIVNGAVSRPEHESPVVGNLTIAVRDLSTCKNLRCCNHIGKKRMDYIEKLARQWFDMELFEYMERRYYKEGVDYQASAWLFYEEYKLEGFLTFEALLQKHVRWKNKRRNYIKNSDQLEIDLDF